MSHNSDEVTICPNCRSEAKGNYCYQCGQATHLHKETFWALILHVFEHYFHYDSKFWQTMKALWFSPGKLTMAYWSKQRARYLSPVSLYIFISAVYFLFFYMFAPSEAALIKSTSENKLYNSGKEIVEKTLPKQNRKAIPNEPLMDKFFRVVNDPEAFIPVIGKAMHNIPKIFFCMIPAMALLINWVFYKRKDLNFVDHAIFSLHVHSFHFSISIVTFALALISQHLVFFKKVSLLISVLYFIVALHNAYKTSIASSVLRSLIVIAGYVIVFCLALVIDVAALIFINP